MDRPRRLATSAALGSLLCPGDVIGHWASLREAPCAGLSAAGEGAHVGEVDLDEVNELGDDGLTGQEEDVDPGLPECRQFGGRS